MKITTFEDEQIPQWAVCYIEYGEDFDLDEEDLSLVRAYLDDIGEEHPYADVHFDFGEGEGYFSRYPEFGLPCTVVDTTITIMETKS